MAKALMDAGGNLSLSGTPPVTGSATPTSVPSTKVKAEGQGVYFDKIDFTIPPGATNGTCTSNSPFNGSIMASASKIKDKNGKSAVLDGDNVNVSIPGILSGGGACTISAKVTANASQSKVEGV